MEKNSRRDAERQRAQSGNAAKMREALEAKLLIIRELTDTTVGKRKNANIPEKERQVHDARIRVDIEHGLRGRKRKVNPLKAEMLDSHRRGDGSPRAKKEGGEK